MKELNDIRVAEIVTLGTIVINKGFLDGINDLMEFLVYETGKEIIDPSNGRVLGILEKPKGKFKVMHIQGKMSTLVTTLKMETNPFSFLSQSIQLQTNANPELTALNSIKIGDKVMIINNI